MKNKFESSNLVPAAVLIPLFIDPSARSSHFELKTRAAARALPLETDVLFTVRTDHVEHHKGQISFPGGVQEEGETLEQTALRETEEEIGLLQSHVEVVAELPDFPTVKTKFVVKPFVGLVQTDSALKPNPHEISKLLRVPLAHLLNPANVVRETYERDSKKYVINAYHHDGNRIWGATGMMLQHFLERLISVR